MKILSVALVVGLLVGGCAAAVVQTAVNVVGPDVKGAAMVLKASEALLPDGDPWLVCMTTLDALNVHLLAGPAIAVPECAGRPCLVTEAARLHVLDTLMRYLPPGVQASCGQVFAELLVRAGMRTPGF